MKQFSFLIILTTLICCKEVQTNLKETNEPFWQSEFKLDPTIEFINPANAAYGFSYMLPSAFIEQVDTLNLQIGNVVYLPENGEAKLNLFVEGLVRRNFKTLNEQMRKKENYELMKHHKLIMSGKHNLSENLLIDTSNVIGTQYGMRNSGTLQYIGEKDGKEIVWVIELSPIPASGDLIFKNMYFEYPMEEREYYHPIGIKMLNRFGYLK